MTPGQWPPQATQGYHTTGMDSNRHMMQQRPTGAGTNTAMINTQRSGFGVDNVGMGQKLAGS